MAFNGREECGKNVVFMVIAGTETMKVLQQHKLHSNKEQERNLQAPTNKRFGDSRCHLFLGKYS